MTAAAPVEGSSREHVFIAPVSFAQKRLWFLHRLEPGSPAFHICSAVEMAGPLDASRMAAALQHVVDRHEALRTHFIEENGEPFQAIAPSLAIPMLPEEAAEGDVEGLVRQEFAKPFDLGTGPVLRVRLLRIAPDRHVLVAVIHHIAADGWSMGRLVDEMVRLYRGETLEPLVLQYADFAEWQHEYLSGARLRSLLDYWTARLSGAPEVLPLATDRPRSPNPDLRCGTLRFSIDRELAAALRTLSASSGATLFMTLLAGFAATLSRYSAEYDIPIGTPVANRQRREIEPLIGMFVNTMVLRADLSGEPTFRELLRRIRTTALEAFEHQDLPFEKIVEAIRPGRSTAFTPLFQAMFVFESAADTQVEFEGLRLRPMTFEKRASLFDLTLTLAEHAEGIAAVLEYSSALFDSETIEGFSRHFVNLLRECAARPDMSVAALEILDPAERELLLKAAVRPQLYPRAQTIHGLFEAQAATKPSAVALVQGDRTVTYGELNARADFIAAELRERGVGLDSPVAVCMDRSPELIAAILGILKAGAGYLSIDPNWPRERIDLLVRDSGAEITIGENVIEGRASRAGVAVAPGPLNLAYISYTSGSTGTPKGVAVPHRAVVRLAKSADYVNLDPSETMLMFAPLAFDASTLEVWGSLLNGARLVLAPPMASLAELARCIRENRVTVCWLSAGLFQAMVDEHLEDLLGVRQLLAGGDVLSPPHVARFVAAAPHSRLINGYGPTENTTFTCCYPMSVTLDSGSVPIGVPIPNTSVYIVDNNLQLTPPGVPGELVTGGDGLARGYHTQAALTAEKFIPNPFDTAAGSRLYRTGDRVRCRRDGAIEFLGRMDRQVKMRGFRIEPGEIEALLMNQPGIREAAVDIHEEGAGKRLVAWVVAGADQYPSLLQAALKAKLPDYSVPSAFVFVDELPLNPNGKVDRARLPEPQAPVFEAAELLSPTEGRLALLWSELMGQKDFPRNADFFRSGGHSLLASQLVSRIRREFGVEFPLRRIFELSVLCDQAAAIEAAPRGVEPGGISAVSRHLPIPLSHSQERLWLVCSMDPESTAYNVPAALRLKGTLDRKALTRSLQAIVDRHEILRTGFSEIDGRLVQWAAPSVSIDLTVIQAGEDPEGLVASRIQANASHRFDLARPPLLRVELIRVNDDEHVLLTVLHHIVCDGWSMGVFVAEWKAFYAQFSGHASHRLRALPIQYADYAAWERRALLTGQPAGLDSYWESALSGAPAFLDLPTDFPRSAMPSFRGASCPFTVGSETLAGLKAVAASAPSTLFMTALAAFGVLLERYSGKDRVAVASAAANRHRPELEPLIGCFVNTLPLVVDLRGDPSFEDLLARVRQMSLETYAHQDTPFERIVEMLGLPRAGNRAPFGQVGFALQTFSIPELTLPGLEISLIESEIRSAKAEITLALSEGAGSLLGAIEFNADLFEPDTIQAIAADFVRLVGEIAAHPARRCSELLERSGVGAPPLASLPENRSNLTRGQLLAWLGQTLKPDEPVLNSALLFSIPRAIDEKAFRAAFSTLLRSSDNMRSVYREVDGVPQRVAVPDMPCSLTTVDFSNPCDPDAAMAWAEEHLSWPIPMEKCCFDCALIKLGSEHYLWYFGAHHLLADGLAFASVFRLMGELYTQALEGTLPETIPIPQYADHTAWERNLRSTRQYRAAESWWRKKLERPAEPIPFYGRLARHNTCVIESLICELGDERSRRLREFRGVLDPGKSTDRRSLFEFFGAVLTSLMYRISGCPEIAVGLSFHNRRSSTARGTVGHFMSVVPIRMAVTHETDTAQSLSRRFGSTAFEAFTQAVYVVGNPPARRNYEVFYNYQINSFPTFHGVPVTTRRVLTNREEDTVALHITDYGELGNIGVQLDFKCSEFTPAQRRQTLDLFVRIIDGCLESPNQPIHVLDLLTGDERSRLLAPPARLEIPAARTVIGLFEEHARRQPSAAALAEGESVLSYGELDAAATALASQLQALGLGPETMVAILLSRGVGQIVALLALLKAGGAYVPIDADLPSDRIRYMIENSGARAVITVLAHETELGKMGVSVLCMDGRKPSSHVFHAPVLHPENAAYAIYTSGSSGRPKGVVVTHGALLNAYYAWEDAYGLGTAATRHLQMANFSFDVFTGDWVRALCSGGTLVLCPREHLLSPDLLADLIREQRIDCAEFVPAVARNLMAYLRETGGNLHGFKVCIVGSDTWTAAEYRETQSLCGPATRLVNSYGLTEATIDSAYFEAKDCAGLPEDVCVPIGKAFPNMQLLVLDPWMHPQIPGVPGELCVSGGGLARGYLGSPALTAERFVPHPSPRRPGERIYRTGDRARLSDSGDVEFLGRMDNQVKLRGMRIDLTEIEAVLSQHPGVRQAAALLRGTGPAARIVAWVEPLREPIAAEALRSFAAISLPPYMVPSLFVHCERLPLTPSGKIDRRALPEAPSDAVPSELVAPRNALEEQLAEIWKEVLRIPETGVTESFFEIGGNSLLAAQIVSRAGKAAGVVLPLRSLFEQPTIVGQAQQIELLRLAQAAAASASVNQADREEGEL